MKELTDKERSEIQEAEEARSVNFIMYMYTLVYTVYLEIITVTFIS